MTARAEVIPKLAGWHGQAALHPFYVPVNCYAGAGLRWKTRMFYPAAGVPEDPATGSRHATSQWPSSGMWEQCDDTVRRWTGRFGAGVTVLGERVGTCRG